MNNLDLGHVRMAAIAVSVDWDARCIGQVKENMQKKILKLEKLRCVGSTTEVSSSSVVDDLLQFQVLSRKGFRL
ncbi:hypothetical protein CKAN_00178100 [Cinnamomum micranthum f. kanehirae]|uniref:Uncharacterized protein n=1 Tax=Cinnamomum micranthum f. kanehirae TaxID=337451 RepID=A0A3S3MGV7_9MAGN|nr:hypothetical protein CKAN_00178100 [Cinnamomum micranthum f. kanehirae]